MRTTNFKRTFGNWDYDPNTEVKVTDITDMSRDFGFDKVSELKKWLVEQYKGQTVTINDDGTVVGFTVRGINDSFKGLRQEGKVSSYAALEELIKNAQYFDFEKNDGKPKHRHLHGQDVYYSAMQIGKKIYSVKFKFDIAKDSLSSTYKGHQVAEIKISPVSHYTRAGKNSTGAYTTTGDSVTLSDLTGGVKPSPAVKVLDANGEPLMVAHGTGRADRVGSIFRKDRATSGPMAFFTDNEEIAEGYARDKVDTSLSREDAYDYHKQFTVDVKGKGGKTENFTVSEYWNKLPLKKQREIAERAQAIGYNDDEEIVLIPGNKIGSGGYEWNLREARGNHLDALVREWLDGHL